MKDMITSIESVLRPLRDAGRTYQAQLALCLRATVAAVSTLLLAKTLQFPLYLWAVLTAVILSHVSFGRSLKATIDYVVGTLGGVVYAGIVGVLIHPSDDIFPGRSTGDRGSPRRPARRD